MSEYPEHEKLKENEERFQVISEFLEWLQSEDIVLGKWSETERGEKYEPVSTDTRMIYKFLGVDEKTLEFERKEMIAAL